jgi:RNA polymerase sigma-70 factor (ECF subfamily)
MSRGDHATEIQGCLDRLRSGDAAARDELLAHAAERLTRLTRKMLRDFPGVHRWEQTDDVLQNAAVRLCRALAEVQPATVGDFFRLAAALIRRELLDLARRYAGAEGLGGHHARVAGSGQVGAETLGPDPADSTHDPDRLAAWTNFHREVEALPGEEREVFDLLFYQGLSQAEAVLVLGISQRTLQRRWRAARLRLSQALGEEIPGL